VSITPSGTAWVSSAWVTLAASASVDAFLTGVSYRTQANVGNLYLEVDIGVGAAASEVVIATLRGGVGVSATGSYGMYQPCPIWISGITSGVRVAARIRTGSTNTTAWNVSITTVVATYTGENILTTAQPSHIYPPAAVNITLPYGGSAWANGAWTTIKSSTASAIVLVAYNILIAGNHASQFEVDFGTGGAGSETVIDTVKCFGVSGGTGDVTLWNPLDNVGNGVRLAARCRTGNPPLYNTILPSVAVTYHEKPL
jgi:hypothetical protein